MPFRREIIEWCKNHTNFTDALKLLYVHKFVEFSGTTLTSSPAVPQDQVIGIVVYDLNREILKQDFMVDNGSRHNHFTLYTKLPKGMGYLYEPTVVESIENFYKKYDGGGKYYQGTHWPELSSLHPELQERILRYLTITHRKLKPPPQKTNF